MLLAQQMGVVAASPASLELQVPLGSGSPPAQIVLSGTGFQPNEQLRLTGTLSGQRGAGHVASVALALSGSRPKGKIVATGTGDLGAISLTVPDSSRFFGRYHVRVLATGNKGSQAAFDVTAGGMPADYS